MRRHTNQAVQPQEIAYVLKSCMSEVQGMYYLCWENIVADHLTAQLLRSCAKQFPHDVAQMHLVQIRDLRVPYSSPLCLLIGV